MSQSKQKLAPEALDPATRAGVVADWIREQIVTGAFKPGLHLQEQALAARTGVSRTPIREALKLLENEQLVIYSPNRGYVVRRFTLKDVLDTFDVRSTLEGMVCRIVAEQGLSPAADAEFHECMQEMDAIVSRANWRQASSLRWFDLNFRLHRTLIREANNATLERAIDQTQKLPLIFDAEHHLRSPSQVSRLFSPDDLARSHRDHEIILDAIRKRQGSRAEFAMREHIFATREAIRRNYEAVYDVPKGD